MDEALSSVVRIFRHSAVMTAVICAAMGVGCTAEFETRRPSPTDVEPGPKVVDTAFPDSPVLRLETGMHTASVWQIGVDAAERYLVSGSQDKTVRVWDLKEGRLLGTLRLPIGPGNVGKVYAVAISPDGRTVAVGGWTGKGWGDQILYLFNRESGALEKRITGLPSSIKHLAFSKDGRRLAATFGNELGVRVYETGGYTQLAEDSNYGGDAYRVDFDASGRLITTSYDGHIRIYDPKFRLLRKVRTPGGKRPIGAAFSPDGRRIAVGYGDTTRVDVLSAADLGLLYSADTSKIYKGALTNVAWSRDGRFLYAGGSYQTYKNGNWRLIVRRWREGGRGQFTDHRVSASSIFDLEPLRDGRLAVAAADPLLAVLGFDEKGTWKQESVIADFRDQTGANAIRLSARGDVVRFGFEVFGKRPARFSLAEGQLRLDSASDPALRGAVTEGVVGLKVTDWKDSTSPKLNDAPLPLKTYERSQSLAIAPGGQKFLLGTEWSLRLFNQHGRELWQVAAPGPAWALNISGDGRLAVAGYGDGTIRWHAMEDGHELLALFPHKDGRRWVAWTPEGFFASSEGGEDLVGYHLNRGADKVPEFVGAEQLYQAFYRPELLVKRLEGNEGAVRVAQAAIGDVREILAAGLPPLLEAEGPTSFKVASRDFDHELLLTDRGGGIGRLVYRVNGVLQSEVDARSVQQRGPEGKLRRRQPLQLRQGENKIEVTAYSADNKVESRAITLMVEVDDPLARPPALYGLAVGINTYRDRDLTLKYAASDALALAETLEVGAGKLFPRGVQIETVTNEDATRTGIEEAFKDLVKRISPNDLFVLYLSGHGYTLDGRYHFIPSELIYENDQVLRENSLSQERLEKLLASVPAQKSLVILDTCYAGAFKPSLQLAYAHRGLEEKGAISRLMRATGRAILYASTDKQVALEGYGEHGVFTYALLQGLRGKADAADSLGRKDRAIGIDELSAYLGRNVPKLTKEKWGYEQFPMRDVQGQDFPISWVE